MEKKFGLEHLDVYQKAVGILDAAAVLSSEGPLGPLFAAKSAEVVTTLIDGLEAWPAEERKEALFRARRVAHHLRPFIEAGARNGLFDEAEAKRLVGEVESVSKMLYAMAKNAGAKKEAVTA